MKKIRIILIILISTNFCYAQNTLLTDSLEKLLDTAKSESRMDILNQLSGNLELTNAQKALDYALEAYEIALELNDTTGKITALIYIGNSYKALKNYSKAIEFQKWAYSYSDSVDDKKGMGVALYNISYAFQSKGNYDSALYYTNLSLDIKKERFDTLGMTYSYSNLGNIYFGILNYELAKQNYFLSLKYAELKEQTGLTISALINIGSVYNDLMMYDSAEIYLLKALDKFENFENDYYLSALYGNFGSTYSSLKKYELALKYKNLALTIDKELEDIDGICIDYNTIGEIYSEMQKFDMAILYQDSALYLARQLNNKMQMYYAFSQIADIYFQTEKYKLSAMFKDSAFIYKDSAVNQETIDKISELQTIYDVEAKERENEILKKTNEIKEYEITKQKNFKIWLSVIIILLFGVIVFFVRSLIIKKKANRILTEKNSQINLQKGEIQTQNEILQQQKEEISAQKDNLEHANKEITSQKDIIQKSHNQITSSINYASRIQKALLPSKSIIDAVFPENFIFWKPRDIVSGDFYYSKKINEFLIIAAADCTGHGVPGAFMSMLGISFLNEIVTKREITKASHVLDELRNLVKISLGQTGERGENQDGMDISLCVINTQNLKSQYAGAYNPLYVVSSLEKGIMNENNLSLITNNSSLIIYNPDKMPIGIHPRDNQPFTNNEFQLQKNDSLYLFSDGYTDQLGGEKNQKYKSEKFKNLLSEICFLPLTEQKQILETKFNEWRGNNEQTDDVLVIGVKI